MLQDERDDPKSTNRESSDIAKMDYDVETQVKEAQFLNVIIFPSKPCLSVVDSLMVAISSPLVSPIFSLSVE